jgi:hypothetical protein
MVLLLPWPRGGSCTTSFATGHDEPPLRVFCKLQVLVPLLTGAPEGTHGETSASPGHVLPLH